jgi:hypothetical protein
MALQRPVDSQGNALTWPKANETVTIVARFVDSTETAHPFAAIIEVRDENGVTIHLEVQTSKANPFSFSTVSTSWNPPTSGRYEFRAFAISNFSNPEVLTATTQKGIVIRPLPQGSTAWVAMNTTQCDNQWNREYDQNRQKLRDGETTFDLFFEKRHIEIYESNGIGFLPAGSVVCEGCSCTSGSTLYLLISVGDVGKMVNEYGFIEQAPKL